MRIQKKTSSNNLFNELNNAVYWILMSLIYLIFIIIMDVKLLYTQEGHEPHFMIFSLIIMAGLIIPLMRKRNSVKEAKDYEYFIEIFEEGINYGIQGLYTTSLKWETVIKVKETKNNISIDCYDRILNLDKSFFTESEISQILNYDSISS